MFTYTGRPERAGEGCVTYEAAAQMSVCVGCSDHRGHVKVEPHSGKLFTSREKKKQLPPLPPVCVRTQSVP